MRHAARELFGMASAELSCKVLRNKVWATQLWLCCLTQCSQFRSFPVALHTISRKLVN